MRTAHVGWLMLLGLAGCQAAAHPPSEKPAAPRANVRAIPDGVPPSVEADAAEAESEPAPALTVRLMPVSSCSEAADGLRHAALVEMNQRLDESLANYLALTSICTFGGSSASSDEAAAASTTNDQVKGVDEADFVKNDQRYIYRVGDGALTVIEAWPAATTRVIGRVAIADKPIKLLVAGDRAVVFVAVPTAASAAPSTPCRYGYD